MYQTTSYAWSRILNWIGEDQAERQPVAVSSSWPSRRGVAVYADKCALCHGENGEGQFALGKVVFPPLWGADSYIWGAGMRSVKTAAGFTKLNMPFGLADPVHRKALLSDQDAWDVAAYMNAQERPQDPRFTTPVTILDRRIPCHRIIPAAT